MSVGTLNAQQIRSLVEDKWLRDSEAVAVGLHVTQSWKLPRVVEFQFGSAEVVRADTVFAVREAILDAERGKGRIVLLTKLRQWDLGNDVVARLARSRLFAIDQWASLCSLFKAKELDRSICDPSIAEALLECAPPDGYPPVSAGILDAGTVWRAICRHVFEMGESEPDLVSLLLWATDSAGTSRYLRASDELRKGFRERLVLNLGQTAEAILRMVDCQSGSDAVAIAVTCQVVFDESIDNHLEAAAARMEQYHDNVPIAKQVGQTLARIANDAIADMDRSEDTRQVNQHLNRADELLKQFLCSEYAYRGRLTLLGYEQRLSRFSKAVTKALDGLGSDSIRECESLHAAVADHRRVKIGQRAQQLERCSMALRLLRWLATPVTTATSLAEKSNVYRYELAFVDWARESICRGEDNADLTNAFRELDREVHLQRERFNEGFARSLADWISVGPTSSDICGVEHVLSQCVAKVAELSKRVLLVVLDGMSWAVCHELLADVHQEHWSQATLNDSNEPPMAVIATVPSITTYSRTSLLTGELVKGDLSLEKKNFESNTSLKSVSDKKHPPVLFHKREVTEGARGVVAEDLSKAILSANQRIVGVVLNAIDDRLSSAQQIREDWTINRISPLGAILKLARDSERVVILASDHGHVWHRPEAKLSSGDAGTRWRSHVDNIRDGELAISGPRVREEKGTHSVIVPWDETTYYGKQQNGYHGGATPQEMVCPFVILVDETSNSQGLFPCEYSKPDWWTAPPVATPEEAECPVSITVVPKTMSTAPSLFEDENEQEPIAGAQKCSPIDNSPSNWIDRLLSSAGYKDQKNFVRRHVPADDLVRCCLETLVAHGGIMTPTAFANIARIPPTRLDGLVSQIQRLLNVDGYEILTFGRSENRIELNVQKLRRQFDLE